MREWCMRAVEDGEVLALQTPLDGLSNNGLRV